MRTVLAIAPHPDDETLGCGGTLMKHISHGDKVDWLLFTAMQVKQGYTKEQIDSRNIEISNVAQAYGFSEIHHLDFPTMMLDVTPKKDMVDALSKIITKVGPEILYIPYGCDSHSDHKVVFDIAASCSKSFRSPTIKSIRAYETLSETEVDIRPDNPGFRPNLFVDITTYLNKKLQIMNMYSGETGAFPFPRSEEAIKALAQIRGTQRGSLAAEAFMILKEMS